jgi:hypothetical protein
MCPDCDLRREAADWIESLRNSVVELTDTLHRVVKEVKNKKGPEERQ